MLFLQSYRLRVGNNAMLSGVLLVSCFLGCGDSYLCGSPQVALQKDDGINRVDARSRFTRDGGRASSGDATCALAAHYRDLDIGKGDSDVDGSLVLLILKIASFSEGIGNSRSRKQTSRCERRTLS